MTIVQRQDAPGRRRAAHSPGPPCIEGKGAVARGLSPGDDLESTARAARWTTGFRIPTAGR